MTVLWGDTGKAAVGPLKTFTITQATPREDFFNNNPSATYFTTNMPTAQTAGIGATFTVQTSDFPTLSPVFDCKYTAFVVVSGKNNSGNTVTISHQPFKNGTSVTTAQTQTGVTAAQFWTTTVFRFYDVQVGDVLNVQVWASLANVSFDYCALFIYPTRLQLSKNGTALKDLTLSNIQSSTLLTTATTPVDSSALNAGVNNQVYYLYLMNNTGQIVSTNASGTLTIPFWNFDSSYGLLRANNGDTTLSQYYGAHSSNRYYSKLALPQTVSFREVSF